jgi:beta-lactamase class A
MPRAPRIATVFVALTFILTACAGSQAQANSPQPTAPPAPTAAPTAVPTAAPTDIPAPTALPALAQDLFVAGVDVGGMTQEDARKKLTDTLAPLLQPLDVRFGATSLTLKPEDIGLELPLDDLIAEAKAAQAGARVGLKIRYDQARLRAALQGLAKQVDQPPAISLISDTKSISRSFALSGGAELDLDAAVKQIDERLRSLRGARRVTLALSPATGAAARPTPDQLQEQIKLMAKQWKGVAGIYVYDLASDQEIASLNKNTVFSAASTIKLAIMLNAYIQLDKFTARQQTALKKMIVESDNLAANTILAAAAGGSGTEDALRGAEQMSAMLKDLGLEHTYLYVPFEALEYLAQRKVKFKLGPKREGDPPYTDSGRALRTTPAEMAQLYLYIDQCSKGKGILLEKFADHLTAARCQEMLDRLETNDDHKRMVAGIPAGVRVEHKSGWIDDMQADVGIVRAPGGDFLVAIYLYQQVDPGKPRLPDRLAMSAIASFARLVYTYYNPVQVTK